MNREQREKCWLSRDKYFACLDRNNIISTRQPHIKDIVGTKNVNEDSLINNSNSLPVDCDPLHKDFTSSCIASWVEHFEKMREKEIGLKYMSVQGYRPLTEADK
jgi:cytochrome c oxidase assembly factor 6